jgi:hypothetical protein
MSEENVEIVRRAFPESGLSGSGVEEAARAGLLAADAELDFSAVDLDGVRVVTCPSVAVDVRDLQATLAGARGPIVDK